MKTYKGKVTEIMKNKDGKIKLIIACEPKVTREKEKDKIEKVTIRYHSKDQGLLDLIGSEIYVNIHNHSVKIIGVK